ncbi:MAG: hypothetical protein CMJ83_11105 [Planctomycetes bacterium]|nr:hypothetical protein [Planctomycetota bacterium]
MDILLNSLNTAIFTLICAGAAMHRRRDLHVKIMMIAFALDIGLLLAVEFSNAAIAAALRTVSDSSSDARILTWVHVTFAVGGLVMWFAQIVVGRKILKQGRTELLPKHVLNARIFLVLRLGNVVTAWMIFAA